MSVNLDDIPPGLVLHNKLMKEFTEYNNKFTWLLSHSFMVIILDTGSAPPV